MHCYERSEPLRYRQSRGTRETEFCSIDLRLVANASNEASFLRKRVAFLASSENKCGKLTLFTLSVDILFVAMVA